MYMTDKINCENCKRAHKADVKCCPYCGTKRVEISDVATKCPKCKEDVEPDYSVCPQCEEVISKQEECPICFEIEYLDTYKCSHKFCYDCVGRIDSQRCPVCKTELLVNVINPGKDQIDTTKGIYTRTRVQKVNRVLKTRTRTRSHGAAYPFSWSHPSADVEARSFIVGLDQNRACM